MAIIYYGRSHAALPGDMNHGVSAQETEASSFWMNNWPVPVASAGH